MEYNITSTIEILKPYAKENIYNLTKKLVFDSAKVIGVCSRDLHKLAKQFISDGTYVYILEFPHNIYYEIDMVQGLIIGYLKIPSNEKFKLLDNFVPYISNWAVCDSTVFNIKPKKTELNLYYDYACNLLESNYDFEIRFGIIMLMRYFPNRYFEILPLLNSIPYGKNYYIDMSVAWLLTEYTIKTMQMGFDEIDNNPILLYLKNNKILNIFTIKKSYQKMRESYRIPDDWKKSLYI